MYTIVSKNMADTNTIYASIEKYLFEEVFASNEFDRRAFLLSNS